MTCQRTIFPFSAIVGQDRMKKALALNAVNPRLGGVLIRGQKGTAKSTAVRALAGLLPQIDVVSDCPFHCDPNRPGEMCVYCRERTGRHEELPVKKRAMQVVELPLGATEDRVLGTLDMEQAIKKGEKHFEPGILASAHRGILYVDEVNLLDDHLVDVLLDSAAMGVNTVEREGVSFSHPARFMLIGTMNPEEGELRPQLLDRFALCVDVEGITDGRARMDVVRRYLKYEKDPHGFIHEWESEEKLLCDYIVKAQKILPEVVYPDEILSLITSIAIDMNVDGHRADIAMLKTAQTIAAYHHRKNITEDDVREAAELVLSHRMRRKPFQEPKVDKEKLEQSMQKHKNQPHRPDQNHESETKKKTLISKNA
jgi:Mg-chelatase subunit ChlI